MLGLGGKTRMYTLKHSQGIEDKKKKEKKTSFTVSISKGNQVVFTFLEI